jgi:pimeloyl-ACP methyl ester carboxylesterase
MTDSLRQFTAHTADGRTLEAVVVGDPGALPIVFHNGTPAATVLLPAMVAGALELGLSLVTYARPGYRSSTPLDGRSVADAATDVEAILDALGALQCVTLGWSGGGPHALATAALLPNRCLAAATIASVAPNFGPEWLTAMGEANVAEMGAAVQGRAELNRWFAGNASGMEDVPPEVVAELFASLVSDVDRASLTGEFAVFASRLLSNAVTGFPDQAPDPEGIPAGTRGWRDDDLAFAQPWGFTLGSITRPVAIWQGGQDRFVPFAHGQYLAQLIPTAEAHLEPEHGHFSLAVASVRAIVADLAALGQRGQ